MKENRKYLTTYFRKVQDALDSINVDEVNNLVNEILSIRRNGNTLFIAGNGGSASTASHFATDLGIGSLAKLNPIRAISLCDNASVITAVANDLNFVNIFDQQLKLLGKPNDLLVLISASGNSENLLRVLETAKFMNIRVFSLTGFDGGKLKKLTLDFNVHINTPIGEYGVVEDIHLSICHSVTQCIRLNL
jgi:D-sedoheptulose 7-phosphate isomerase